MKNCYSLNHYIHGTQPWGPGYAQAVLLIATTTTTDEAMTATATRATARDLGQARKAYANRLEEATGFCIRWGYDQREQAWVFRLIDPYGDVDGDPFYSWADLVDYTQDAIDEYEATWAECEPKLYDETSDADPGL